jgi:hypothetical protein
VTNRLIRTARDLGPAGRDDRFGYGEVNPVAALTSAVPIVRRNPLVVPKAPPAVERFSERTPQADSAHPSLLPLRVLVGAAVSLVAFVLVLVPGVVAARRFTRWRAA